MIDIDIESLKISEDNQLKIPRYKSYDISDLKKAADLISKSSPRSEEDSHNALQ